MIINKLSKFVRALPSLMIRYINYRIKIRKIFYILSSPRSVIKRYKIYLSKKDKIYREENKILSLLQKKGHCEFDQENSGKNLLGLIIKESLDIYKSFLNEEGDDMSKKSSKSYFTFLHSDNDMDSESIFVQYATQKRILNIVTNYFKETPYVGSIDLVLSNNVDPGESWSKSQLWHRDYNDTKMLKLVTYITDVHSIDDGPFTIIEKDICNKYRLPLVPIHKDDQTINKLLDNPNPHYILGKSGFSFFVDTYNCLHRGSRIKSREPRIALIIMYHSPSCLLESSNGIELINNYEEDKMLALTK